MPQLGTGSETPENLTICPHKPVQADSSTLVSQTSQESSRVCHPAGPVGCIFLSQCTRVSLILYVP